MLIFDSKPDAPPPAPGRNRVSPAGQYRPNRTPRPRTEGQPQERRLHRRYGTRLPLLFRVVHRKQVVQCGSGITANISSGGLWFRPDSALSTGLALEILIEWPVTPHHGTPVHLNVQGRVVRAEPRGVAVRIERYSFEPAPVGGAGR